MTSTSGRMDWQAGGSSSTGGGGAPPTYSPPYADPYRHAHDGRGGQPQVPGSHPPPPPYHHGYQYGPPPPHHGAPPPVRGGGPPPPHPHEYWYDHAQAQRRPPPGYGPPEAGSGGPPPYYHGEGRQGPPRTYPPAPPGGSYGTAAAPGTAGAAPPDSFYRRDRPDMMYQPPSSRPSPPQQQPQPYRTPPRRDPSVDPASSFSSKEETSSQQEDERDKPAEWEPSTTSQRSQEEGKKQGDPLSLLAKVSSAMAPPRNRKAASASEQEQGMGQPEDSVEHEKGEVKVGVSVTSPTKSGAASPLQRRLRSSPIITPTSAQPPSGPPLPPHALAPVQRPAPPNIREASYPGSSAITPKPITPTGTVHYGPPPPPGSAHHGYDSTPGGYPPYGTARGGYGPPQPPPGTYPSGYDSRSGSWEQSTPPAVVEERSSFDSLESTYAARSHYPPDYSRSGGGRYPSYPPPHPMEGGGGGWHTDPRAAGQYPPHARWGYEHGPPPPHARYGGGPAGASPYGQPQQQPPYRGGPPPPGYPHAHGPMMHHAPPPHPYYDDRGAAASYHQQHGHGPPHAHAAHPHAPHPPPAGYPPYSYVQQPSLEEKTVLRKKFSWKHFPELERFLIDNRDDYLKFSSRNYTVEQKQFNNMLTERLIELAEKHSYIFDPDEFNFVAIRDRIRCYYKSYVQTARKRGLMLPTEKGKSELDDMGKDESTVKRENAQLEDADTADTDVELKDRVEESQDKEERE